MRPFLTRLFAAFVLAAAFGWADQAAAAPDPDMSLGNPKAKVTVMEYASVACPVCGAWYREVYPAFKAKYIDTGKVHFITREMLVGDDAEVAIASAGFLLARCAGPANYYKVTDAIYRGQAKVYANPQESLIAIAKSVGISPAKYQACESDDAARQALNDRVDYYARHYYIDSTPTFIVNGKAMPAGYHTLAELDAMIAPALAGK